MMVVTQWSESRRLPWVQFPATTSTFHYVACCMFLWGKRSGCVPVSQKRQVPSLVSPAAAARAVLSPLSPLSSSFCLLWECSSSVPGSWLQQMKHFSWSIQSTIRVFLYPDPPCILFRRVRINSHAVSVYRYEELSRLRMCAECCFTQTFLTPEFLYFLFMLR